MILQSCARFVMVFNPRLMLAIFPISDNGINATYEQKEVKHDNLQGLL